MHAQLMRCAGRGVVRRRGSLTRYRASPQLGKHAVFNLSALPHPPSRTRLMPLHRAKIVEFHAQPLPPPSFQQPSNPRDETAAPAPVSCASDDEYDPDIQDSPILLPSSLPPAPPPPRICMVDTVAAAAAAMAALEEHDVFAVDLEGVELGRGGTIAILQVRARVRARVRLCVLTLWVV